MLDLPGNIHLHNLVTGATDAARIHELEPSVALSRIDQRWWALPGMTEQTRLAQPDGTWSAWAAIAAHAKGSDEFLCVACQTLHDREVQGAMLYNLRGHCYCDPAVAAVEVVLLATAPRNRETLCAPPRYRGAGSALLLRAVAHSYLLGLQGRTVLESKPAAPTVQFYLNRGFKSQSRTTEGMICMELPSSAALAWLRDQRLIR